MLRCVLKISGRVLRLAFRPWNRLLENTFMQVLQPAEWSKPRVFPHGVVVDGPGRWIVLAGQTGGDEKGGYAQDMAAQGGAAPTRVIKLPGGGGAGAAP